MSTKIYTGFKFEGNLFYAHKMFMQMREELRGIVDTEYRKLFARHKACVYDRYVAGLEQKPSDVNFNFWKEVSDRQQKSRTTMRADPAFDFDFEVVLFPITASRLLGIYYTTQTVFSELLMSKNYIKEYGYWNNSDRPDHIGEREWAQREKDWDLALPDSCSIPSMNGMTVQLVEHTVPIFRNGGLAGYFPSLEKRSRNIATEMLWEDHMNFQRLDKNSWNSMGVFSRYLRTRHGKQALGYYQSMIEPKLYSEAKLLLV